MANLDLHGPVPHVTSARKAARRTLHVHRAQTMALVSGLAALGMVAVAGAMLTQML
ncbi:hypothetical protein IC608_09020 [Devosia sp. PTR5]|jgi:hypothetical protein|uniref:Uncharacterized protein n=1 Tax=Devosia oryzisoli TaxID=2774138 RepID=A0A927FX42_9HYPH|nr:hypothetical protein [Devosia oryzisoli]MBD8065616.1 hypothetical protein [Devosia oryzisoli]